MLNTELLKGIQDLAKHMSHHRHGTETLADPAIVAGDPAGVQWKMNLRRCAKDACDQWHAGLRGAAGQRSDPGLRRRGQPVSLRVPGRRRKARLSRRRDNPGRERHHLERGGCSYADVTTKTPHFGRRTRSSSWSYLQVKNWARLYCPRSFGGLHAGRTRREGTW